MPLTRPPLSFLNSNSTVFNDPLLVLHQGSSSADSDVGFVFNRANGLVANVAVYWSETDDTFYTAYTNSGGATDANLVPTSYAPFTVGTLNANNAVVTGNLTVSGTTTTINTTNSTISDSLIELNSGAGSNSNDLGFIFERGSTGDNAAFIWDESADVFVLGTTTATGASTGDLTVSQVGLHAGSITINSAYTFPTSDGSANQVLTTNGSGTLSFADASGGGGDVVSDTSPQLGGDLDVNGQKITSASNGHIEITPNGTGKVGIGTSSPLTQLVTVGTSMATSQAFVGSVADTSYSGGIINLSNSSRSVGITADPTNAGTGSLINFSVDGSERMRITSDGDVGIGTTPSLGRLHIYDDDSDIDMDATASGQLHIDGNGYGFGIALNASGAQIYTNSASRDLIFGTNETERMRIDGSGDATFSANVTASHFIGTATQALYADLAEKYVADTHYEPGTVMTIGGSKEVTASNSYMDPTVAGVVSTNPAFLMNKDLVAEHVVDLALTGRVPCKVHGIIKRGDMIVSGNIAGAGTSCTAPKFGTVVGKALENYNSEEVGIIEVIAGRL